MKHRRFRDQQRLDNAFLRVWREDARKAQKSRCAYCHDPLTASTATADHVVARHNHGRNDRSNIVAACRPCNKLKGHRTEKEFRKLIEKPVPGAYIGYWLAWYRLRINRRLEKMERFFDRFYGRKA